MPKHSLDDAPDYAAAAESFVNDLFPQQHKQRPPKQRRVVQAANTAGGDSTTDAATALPGWDLPVQLRRYASALERVEDPNAGIMRNAIVLAGRDQFNPATSLPVSSGNMFTVSHGPGAAWRDMMDDTADTTFEKLAPFFGLPTRPVPRDPYLSNQVDIHDLPFAYEGRNRYLEQTLFFQLVKTDMTLLRFGLPVVRNDSTASIVMSRHIYDPALLGRLPYESAPRLVTSRRDTKEFKGIRMGLGAMSEWGFWNHEEGKKDWLYKQDQIAFATQRTVALYAVMALLHCMKVPSRVEEMRSQPYDSSSWREAINHELNMWNVIVAQYHGLQALADMAREELADRHVTAEESSLMLVIPQGAEKFTVHAPERTFKESGIPKLNYDDPQSIRLRGIGHLHVSKPFMVGASERPIDPIFRLRAIGYMWKSNGFPHVADVSHVKIPIAGAGDIKGYFEEPSDDWGVLTHKMQVDYCGLFNSKISFGLTAAVYHGRSATAAELVAASKFSLGDFLRGDQLVNTDRVNKMISIVEKVAKAQEAGDALFVATDLKSYDAAGHVVATIHAGIGYNATAAAVAAWMKTEPLHGTSVRISRAHSFLNWCYAHGVPVPLNTRVIAPHVRYRVGQGILLVGGGAAGVTMAGNPDATVGMNPKTKIVSLAFSINLGAHVLHPEKVVVIPNAYVQRYVAGCVHNSFMDPTLGRQDVSKYLDGGGNEKTRKSLFAILAPHTHESGFAIARVGASGYNVTSSTEMICPTMGLYADLYGWKAQEYDVFSYHHTNPVQWEASLCFQQQQFNHAVNADGNVIPWGHMTADRGHWQRSVTDTSCLKYRCGQIPVPPNFVPSWARQHAQARVF